MRIILREFPQLLFEVLVRLGWGGGMLRIFLLDCVLAVPPSRLKELPLRLLLLRIRLFAPSVSYVGESPIRGERAPGGFEYYLYYSPWTQR